MSVSAFKLSGLWQPGSRVSLRYYFTAEDPDVLNQFIVKLKSLNQRILRSVSPKTKAAGANCFKNKTLAPVHCGSDCLVVCLSLWAMSQLVLQAE